MVVTWHEFWGEYWHEYLPDRPMVARIARAAESGCRLLGDASVAVSSFTAQRIAGDDGRPAPSIVENGVSIPEIGACSPATRVIDALFVGRLIADKRVDDLLRAVAAIESSGRHVRTCIVGDGPERVRLEQLAADLGIAGSVTFTGHLTTADVFGCMKAGRVLVLPSVREGYGMTVVEGQAAGAVPVVVRSPMSAASMLVRDGVDGVTCEPGPRALQDAITGLLEDGARRSRLRAAARTSAMARDWDVVAGAMETVYRSVAQRRSKSMPVRQALTPDG